MNIKVICPNCEKTVKLEYLEGVQIELITYKCCECGKRLMMTAQSMDAVPQKTLEPRNESTPLDRRAMQDLILHLEALTSEAKDFLCFAQMLKKANVYSGREM